MFFNLIVEIDSVDRAPRQVNSTHMLLPLI